MAVRNPLYYSSGNLREMSASQVSDLVNYAIYLYSVNPSVVLSTVSSGGNLGNLSDTRLRAGASSTSTTAFPSANVTQDVSVVTSSTGRITQSIASTSQPADTSSVAYPVYYDGNNIRPMSAADMYDTFITPAINTLVSGTISTSQGGTYRIGAANQNSLSGHTLIGTAFIDTRANAGAYTSGGIPEALDQPTTIAAFSLFRINGSLGSFTIPVQAEANGNIKTYAAATFESLMSGFVRHAAASVSGLNIRYSYSTGTNRGSGMTDTRLNGTNYQTRFVNADDYRAQEFPGGSPTVRSTYFLKIGKS